MQRDRRRGKCLIPGHAGANAPTGLQQGGQPVSPFQEEHQLPRFGALALARQAVEVDVVQIEAEIPQLLFAEMGAQQPQQAQAVGFGRRAAGGRRGSRKTALSW